MPKLRRLLLPTAAVAIAVVAGGQQSPTPRGQLPPDRSQYNLLNPTPGYLLREMSTDRPDQTESPYTVDAGHLQVELDLGFAEFVRGYPGRQDTSTTWGVVPFNLKLGLLNNVDLQVVAGTYGHTRSEDLSSGNVKTASGFGDVQTRLKINFWGNDGGRTAFGVLPYLKWPLPQSGLRNGMTEGGVILPFAMDLGDGWSLGAMTEFDFVAGEGGGHEQQFVNSVTVGRGLTGKLGVYAEFVSVTRGSPDVPWQAQANAGWTYALGPNLQLDGGSYAGLF